MHKREDLTMLVLLTSRSVSKTGLRSWGCSMSGADRLTPFRHVLYADVDPLWERLAVTDGTRIELVSAAAHRHDRRVQPADALPAGAGDRLLTGVGAVVLRALIGLIHNCSFKGVCSFAYDANILEGPSRWGNWVIPVADHRRPGRRLSCPSLRTRGQGPRRAGGDGRDLLQAAATSAGQVAVIKSLASALSIGSGAAVGREGPIIQIGAALGSPSSQLLNLSTHQKITLLSAGAGAGIAATFNTPIGGVLFALEILLPEVSNRTFLPVVIATGAATLLGRILIGPNPAFTVPELQFPPAGSFGDRGGAGLRAARRPLRTRGVGLHPRAGFMEDGFPKLLPSTYVQNVIGMGLVGADDGRADERVRPHLCRRRRLWRDPVDPRPRHDGRAAPDPAVRAEAARHQRQPGLGRFRRHLLAVALSRRDARARPSRPCRPSSCRTPA